MRASVRSGNDMMRQARLARASAAPGARPRAVSCTRRPGLTYDVQPGRAGDRDRVRRIGVMMPGDAAVDGITPPAEFDGDSATWVRSLTGPAEQREAALARLHEMLLRIALSELRRRSGQLRITGPELDDLAYRPRPTRCWPSWPRSVSSGAKAGSRPGRTSS